MSSSIYIKLREGQSVRTKELSILEMASGGPDPQPIPHDRKMAVAHYDDQCILVGITMIDPIHIDGAEAVDAPKVVVLESPKRVTSVAKEYLKKELESVFPGFKAIVLDDYMRLSNQIGYQPTSIYAKVGNLEVNTTTLGWTALIDNEQLPPMTRMEIILQSGNRPVVKVEFCTEHPSK